MSPNQAPKQRFVPLKTETVLLVCAVVQTLALLIQVAYLIW